jgi:hypothetical protein
LHTSGTVSLETSYISTSYQQENKRSHVYANNYVSNNFADRICGLLRVTDGYDSTLLGIVQVLTTRGRGKRSRQSHTVKPICCIILRFGTTELTTFLFRDTGAPKHGTTRELRQQATEVTTPGLPPTVCGLFPMEVKG